MIIYRQGDVILATVEALPEGAKLLQPCNSAITLALGEVSGHAHTIIPDDDASYFADGDHRYVKVESTIARAKHPEHGTLYLPRGIYRQVFQVGACARDGFDPEKRGALIAEHPRFGKLYELSDDLRLLQLRNSTKEKDGTYRMCWMPIIASYYGGEAAKNPHAAVACTWRVAPDSTELFFTDWNIYDPLVET